MLDYRIPVEEAAQCVISAIEELDHSDQVRDRRIGERLAELLRDSNAENEIIHGESTQQFLTFFLAHPLLGLPKITLTPDGTLRARWIKGPGNFTAIEFIGAQTVRLVAEVPRDQNQTAKIFATEPIKSVVEFAQAIGATLS